MNYPKLSFFLFIIVILSFSLQAKIWRVDNDLGNAADFRSLSAAHSGASSGDTLYFAGSSQNYDGHNISKKLTIIGPGYFLSNNPETQASTKNAKINSINFYSGSSGTTVMGMYIYGMCWVGVSNITVKRCRFSSAGLDINEDVFNMTITQNYIYNNYHSYTIDIEERSQNIIISNNIIRSPGRTVINMNSSAAAHISNNIFEDGTFVIRNCEFYNNIIDGSTFDTNSNNLMYNNLCDAEQLPTGEGNQLNVDMTTVFTYIGSSDGRYQLLEGSPAAEAGTNGYDCGAYGGPLPYMLSGIPPIPTIYRIEAPASGTDTYGLPVTIKVKSRN